MPFMGALLFCMCSCNNFLDVKSDDKLVVPQTVEDLQSLLDYNGLVNLKWPGGTAEACSDDYYITNTDFSSLPYYVYANIYIWANNDLFPPSPSNEWNWAYMKVYVANAVLDQMKQMQSASDKTADWNRLKGEALFLRSITFLSIVNIWSLAFDESTADKDLGIPLRLNANFNEPSTRSSVRQTYNQIVQDLTRAASLLPVHSLHPVRPSKAAAFAYLARTYLAMRKYEEAGLYADSCLGLQNTLLDFNDEDWVDTTDGKRYGIKAPFNPEIIYNTTIPPIALLNTYQRVDSSLYESYASNDLRKLAFFRSNDDGSHTFIGNYTGTVYLFGGIAVDEVYLMRAECYARSGQTAAAMNDINHLLKSRWKKETFMPLAASSPKQALKIILDERRKELLLRVLRWMDLKRYNKEGANIVVRRLVNNKMYSLSPNDLRYALPIPEDIINFTEMKQNPR